MTSFKLEFSFLHHWGDFECIIRVQKHVNRLYSTISINGCTNCFKNITINVGTYTSIHYIDKPEKDFCDTNITFKD